MQTLTWPSIEPSSGTCQRFRMHEFRIGLVVGGSNSRSKTVSGLRVSEIQARLAWALPS